MKKLISLGAIILLCGGCASMIVPKTVIQGSVNGQPFKFSGPKDVALSNLVVVVETNGTMRLELKQLEASMSPEVISMSGKVFIDSINAIGTQIQSAAGAAVK